MEFDSAVDCRGEGVMALGLPVDAGIDSEEIVGVVGGNRFSILQCLHVAFLLIHWHPG